ncbi:MAG: Omp28-related outer membrane protein [Bacteroidales bacterium]|nr:Omp28-related outer membrane protein [Bacteroidales bacterium]
MKKIAIILFSLAIVFSSCDKTKDATPPADPNPEFKPTVVKTDARPKNVVIENFTGVRCGHCPDGHAILQGILDANPGRAFGVACHPENGSYNSPYGTDEDLRRTFLNAFWTSGFAGYLAMPVGMVSRRVWSNGNRTQSRGEWENYANTIMGESSPVNIGVTSKLVGDTLITEVEIYYTDSVANGHTLYCYLTESDIITKQAGGGDNYVHHRVFRESFSGQWGDELNVEKKAGTFIRYTYKYLYTASTYNMAECHLLVFIRDADTEEIITGNSAHVGEATEGNPS